MRISDGDRLRSDAGRRLLPSSSSSSLLLLLCVWTLFCQLDRRRCWLPGAEAVELVERVTDVRLVVDLEPEVDDRTEVGLKVKFGAESDSSRRRGRTDGRDPGSKVEGGRRLRNKRRKSIRTPFEQRQAFYSPCSYPLPSDADRFTHVCNSVYLGSSVFCDPDYQFSRTEADALLVELGKLNVSSCLCQYPNMQLDMLEPCARFKGQILFARRASLIIERTTSNNNDRSNRRGNDRWRSSSSGDADANVDRLCDTVASSTSSWRRLDKIDQIRTFADNLIRTWQTDSCELDWMLLVIDQWHPSDQQVVIDRENDRGFAGQVSYVVEYFGRNFRRQFRNSSVISVIDDKSNIGSSSAVHQVIGGYTAIFNKLRSLIAEASIAMTNANGSAALHRSSTSGGQDQSIDKRSDSTQHNWMFSMPDWAFVLFIVCTLTLPFCVLVGNVVSIVPTRRFNLGSTSEHPSVRWAHKRWRAGFGGGFFGIRWKATMTTGSDPSVIENRIKPQSNNMMFRHFSKLKKQAKNNAPTACSDNRGPSLGGTYV